MKFNTLWRISWMPAILVVLSLACAGLSASPTATAAAPGSGSQSGPSALSAVNLPDKRANEASDQDSSANAKKKLVSGGERFVKGVYERPFNANTMDTYFPYIDIIETQAFVDSDWGFETITLAGPDANGQFPAKYGAEIDLNRDGRGDWLILASNPSSTDWTNAGVQVWHDANGDVGGSTPMIADSGASGNGFETLAFDGNNPSGQDLARVKLDSANPNTIVIAFKKSLLGNPLSFAIGAWAGMDALDPAKFDFNDHMTHAEAGSPLPDLNVYPLKQLAQIDNTCRMAVGFVPNGTEPGLCPSVQPDHSGAAPKCTPTVAGANPCP